MASANLSWLHGEVPLLSLLRFLDEIDFLEPFQTGARPALGTEPALVALADNLRKRSGHGECIHIDPISQKLGLLLEGSAL